MSSNTILFIVEQGGYPVQHIEQTLRRQGYTVHLVHSMRKALSQLASLKPDVIVAEFNYSTHFRDRISNLEPLFARLQAQCPASRVIALLDREHEDQLEKLRFKTVHFDKLFYPLDMDSLVHSIRETLGSPG